jgi:hypothetical protein
MTPSIGGCDHNRPVAQLGLIVEDLLKLIGGQSCPVALCHHDRPLDHDGDEDRARCRIIEAERQKTITLLRRIVTDSDALVERPSIPSLPAQVVKPAGNSAGPFLAGKESA